MHSMKLEAPRLLTLTCIRFSLVAPQAQHSAGDRETHTETEYKTEHILEIQESNWKIFFFLNLRSEFL